MLVKKWEYKYKNIKREDIDSLSQKFNIPKVISTIILNRKIPLSDIAENGRNDVEITLINNLRNLLGPHHLEEGECLSVGPGSFFKEKCVWNYTWNQGEQWNDGYCFVETGLC